MCTSTRDAFMIGRLTLISLRMMAAIAVAAAMLLSCTEHPKTISPSSGDSESTGTADLQNLVGTWVRPDGGYVIEVRSISASGRVEAGYFNPRPIHVSRAEASLNGGFPELYLELQDRNYPGSYYDLTYDPKHDLLKGTYFQAAIRQTFEVVFVRRK